MWIVFPVTDRISFFKRNNGILITGIERLEHTIPGTRTDGRNKTTRDIPVTMNSRVLCESADYRYNSFMGIIFQIREKNTMNISR